MYPFITILGRTIPLYYIMSILGAAAMILLSVYMAKKRGKIPSEDIFYMLLYAGIGCLIGAKLLYILISVKIYWYTDLTVWENLKYWAEVLTQGGLVFYGGLVGALLGAVRYTSKYKLPVFQTIETAVPAVPLFHGFGRIGCFLSGCCYGMKYDGICAVTFTNAIAAPNGISLFPVQLTEALLNFVLCGILCVIYIKKPYKGLVSGLYLIAYSIIRFCLEYLRGDIIRGHFGTLSTSQWISIAVFVVGVIIIAVCRRKNVTNKG